MILTLLIAQAVVSAPAPPRRELEPPADPSRLSLIVADTLSETDPQPLCGEGRCNSLYLARYGNAVVLAGPSVGLEFTARVEMGSPWNMQYRLALIVEHRDGREPLVRAMAGFGDRTHEACFDWRDTRNLGWQVSGPRIVLRREVLCVTE
ncbi:MAG TPA: hypothetical protein VF702_08615 [Allosphingosinicella sp.]